MDFSAKNSWVFIAGQLGRIILAAVLVIALLLPFTRYRERLFLPVGQVTGRLGPLEPREQPDETPPSITIQTDDGAISLVSLQPNGQIVAYLQAGVPTEPVTIDYQGQTALRLQTTSADISEYPAGNNWLMWLLLPLMITVLVSLIFPTAVERWLSGRS